MMAIRGWVTFCGVLLLASRGVLAQQGPPLDVAGTWEAVPYFLGGSQGSGPYPRLELRLVKTDTWTDINRIRFFSFEYDGRWTVYQIWDYRLPADFYEKHGDCRDVPTTSERRTDTYVYQVRLTNIWTSGTLNDRIGLSLSEGVATLISTPPRWHSIYDKSRVFSIAPSSSVPAPNSQGARLEPRWAAEYEPQNTCYSATSVDTGRSGYWRIASAPPSTNFAGSIRGRVKSTVPLLVENGGDELHRATIRVYRLEESALERANFSSDSEYAQYLRTISQPVGKVVNLKPEDKGVFRIDDLPVLGKIGVTNGQFGLVRYAVEISNGEADEQAYNSNNDIIPGRTNVLSFQHLRVANLLPGDTERPFLLAPFSDFQAKRQITGDLITLAPDNYTAAENDVLDTLNRFENNGVSEANNEAVRRALWAERVMRDGALYAKDLLESAFVSIGNLMADLYGDLSFFNSERIAQARKALKDINDKKPPAEVAAQFELTQDGQPPEAFARLLEAGRQSEALERLGKVVKGYRVRIQQSLMKDGMSEEDAKLVAVVVEQVVLFVINTAQTQSLQGATKDLVKLAIKSGLPKLTDSLYDSVLPVSYARLTRPSAEYVAENLKTWSVSDQAGYLRDRAYVVQILSDLSERMSIAIQQVIYLQFSAEAADTSQRVFGAAGVVFKWAAALEKAAKISKYLSNAQAVAIPVVRSLLDAPKAVEQGIHFAFGSTAPQSVRTSSASLVALSPPTLPVSPALVVPPTNAISAALRTLQSLLLSNKLGSAATLMANEAAGGYLAARKQWEDAITLFALRLQSLRYTNNPGLDGADGRLLARETELLMGRQIIEESFRELLGDALLGRFSGSADPVYLLARNQVMAQIEPYLQTQTEFWIEADLLAKETSLFNQYPAVPVLTMDLSSPFSVTTGANDVTTTPEEFRLTARVRNVGKLAVDNLAAQLTVAGSDGALTMGSPATLSVKGGTLPADDNAPGGADEATLEWKLRYAGPLHAGAYALSVDLLENGKTPENFVAQSRTVTLYVDDGQSSSPSEPSASTIDPSAGKLEVEQTAVVLTPLQPVRGLRVENQNGLAVWAAVSDNPNLVEVSPAAGEARESGNLVLRLRTQPELPKIFAASTDVRIVDLTGKVPGRTVHVTVSGQFGSAPTVRVGTPPARAVIEWTAICCPYYQVEYSDDLRNWKASPTGKLRGNTGSTLRWTDGGPPATEDPSMQGARFYRVTILPQ